MRVHVTPIKDLVAHPEKRPRALNTLRDRGLVWRACLAFCFVFWVAFAVGVCILVW
jgi:hypothetical protein